MAVTYTDTLLTDRDRIRFHIGDTVENSGPKPAGGNFSDNEIAGLLTLEGTWQRTVAGAYEVLAAAWANQADLTVGPRSERYGQLAENYRKLASEWRDRYGVATGGVGSIFVTRQDAYSDDITAEEA